MGSDSVREIEADIEETRTRLYDTIERIQDKLTVAGIVDEVMGAAGVPRLQNGHDFVLGFTRRHPVPIMIAAAAVGFWFYRMNKRTAPLETIADAEYVEVPALNDGHARVYDPDLPSRHPSTPSLESRATLSTQA